MQNWELKQEEQLYWLVFQLVWQAFQVGKRVIHKRFLVQRVHDLSQHREECIYGYELFNKSPTTFALSSDVPVPPGYLLGPGDEIRINFYGNVIDSVDTIIDRTGIISLPLLGPINIAGLSMLGAQNLIEEKVNNELKIK